ncbi:MAG: 5'-nucleotidase C-terminal domain-containing protein [Actinomycetota bacterium]|nr:5'-nucleotidase C-terminal domain-containing protein [Actinomycetota bacterium]
MSVPAHAGATKKRAALAALATSLLVALVMSPVAGAQVEPAQHPPKPPEPSGFTLTILHNNDGESQLLNAPENPDFGGVARFKTVVDRLKANGRRTGSRHVPRRRGALLLSSGDNFLAGPEFNTSLERGVPFYDTTALDLIGYDAFAIGNHEFDFGPDVLADFIDGFIRPVPFISANLDVRGEPALQTLAEEGRIVRSAVVRERGERIGVVGATTPDLELVSSPRGVEVLQDVAGLVQGQVDRLRRRGVNKIILISHLQDVDEDRALVPMLRGVDVVIAGGGDEVLANPGDLLVPGDEAVLPYPVFEQSAGGRDVPIVTTAGDYKYVGRLVVDFDRRGRVLNTRRISGPVRVSGVAPDAVEPNAKMVRLVTEPVSEAIAELDQNVIAQSDVDLDGRRTEVRSRETNLGNLVVDSQLSTARERADEFGLPAADFAIQNGGGIRNDSVIPAGDITELDTFDIAPFANFVAVTPDVPRDQAKELLEHGVAAIGEGQTAQLGGISIVYDPSRTAQVVDLEGNVTTPGDRIRRAELDDGTVLVDDGEVVDGPSVNVAGSDFLARGGDGYPFRGAAFTTVGVSYQQSLADFIIDDLGGRITAADYPEGGEGRITPTD